MGSKSIQILVETGLGNILIDLYSEQAPLTVKNFLCYVDEERFLNACFYRVVHMNNQPDNQIKIEVIQGGLKDDEHPLSLPAILHENTLKTGILHKDGIISMARNEPGSASSEFFICIGDQPELDYGGKRNPDGQGFAAFGRVIEGMNIVRTIQSQPAEGQYLLEDVPILGIRRDG